MDACGIERIVNITMKTGDEAIRMIDKFRSVDAERFATIGWMDWSGVEKDDFVQVTFDRLERLVEHGAKGIKFWKNLGLSVCDRTGNLLRVDDERLAPIFDKAAELGIPVMFHIADPDAFFLPVDGRNERFEELAAHPDWSFHGAQFSKTELLDQHNDVGNRVIRQQCCSLAAPPNFPGTIGGRVILTLPSRISLAMWRWSNACGRSPSATIGQRAKSQSHGRCTTPPSQEPSSAPAPRVRQRESCGPATFASRMKK